MTVHCPQCTNVYDTGLYTIESADALLGEQTDAVCVHCGALLPVPFLFTEAKEARSFLDRINTTVDGIPARLIPKRLLEVSHVDLAYLSNALKHTYNN